MTRTIAVISLTVLSVAALGQSSTPKATFEIVDIHTSPRGTATAMRTILRGGRYEIKNATMVDLIRTAYGFETPENVFGGPNWVEFDRFDIVAKAANDTSQEALKSMLQSLLADRFQLVAHNETKPLPNFVVTQGKGKHKLKEGDPSAKAGCDTRPFAVRMVDNRPIPETTSSCRNMTMEAFAKELRTIASGYFTTHVTDVTELKGVWDFDLKFTPKALAPVAGTDGVSIFDAIDKQMGLRLEERSLPRTVLVIDQVKRTPTANSVDVEKKLPSLPAAEFEVATLKPVNPNALPRIGGPIGIQPGGRVNLPPLPLRSLISLAWSPPNMDDVVGLPKWVDSARFEVVAKVPPEYMPANGPAGALQDIAPMMQALLTEQFKMKTHYEDRPVTAYTLVAVKPKLKRADPSTRTGCKSTNSAATGFILSGTSLPTTQVTCQNITLAQFADQLQTIAFSYIRYPVVDASGLDGPWDFSFTFTSINPTQLAGLRAALPPAGAPTAPGASDPVGGTTVFDALEKQLGLKLQAEKRSYPVFVIDHIEEKPADN